MSAYDDAVLVDNPIGYWPLDTTSLTDVVGALDGTYPVVPSATTLPNGDPCRRFNGTNQYGQIPNSGVLSVTGSGILTIEFWMRPDVLEFPHAEAEGYVYMMGKGLTYGSSGNQEWACRMYSFTNTESPPRPNRISGYIFNPAGALGAGSYFQDTIAAGTWIHYALTLNTVNTSPSYTTGYTKIFRDGVQRDQDNLSDYNIVPAAGSAPVRVGTMNGDSFFQGGIGKVAIYDYELSPTQLAAHVTAMNNPPPDPPSGRLPRYSRVTIGGTSRVVDLLS